MDMLDVDGYIERTVKREERTYYSVPHYCCASVLLI